MSRTKTLRDKIRYVLARQPAAASSSMSLAIAVWVTFYWAAVDVSVGDAGVAVTFKHGADIARVPGWDKIELTYRRMCQEAAREAARPPTPVPDARVPHFPYKTD